MSFPIKHVANCFLQRDFEDRCATITPMKLQKLVYCLHGWHLAITGEPAIDSNFEAWQYGPVEDSLYHMFKSFRNKPITSYANEGGVDDQQAFVVIREPNKEFYEIFDFVVGRYMPFSANQLSALTHQSGTPWSEIKAKNETNIPNDLIRDHFIAMVK